MFKVFEYVIYKRDLCKIIEIVEHQNKKYYKLRPIEDESLTINIPVDNKLNKLRYPINKKEAEELIERIPSIDIINTNDRLLEQEYIKLMKSDTHEDLIKIIKTTYLRNAERKKNGKKVADKDLSYFQKAEEYLYNELSISLEMTYKECKNYIISKLSTKNNK